MSTSSEIIALFSNQTKLKNHKSNALNLYTARRLVETGVEYKIFECRRKKGLAPENPIVRLFNKGVLTKQERNAGNDYHEWFKVVHARSNHARQSWNGISGSSGSGDSESFFTDDYLTASRKLAEARNKVMIQNIGRDGKKVFSRRYDEVLAQIFERQIAVRVAEVNTGINHAGIERKVKEICEILLK